MNSKMNNVKIMKMGVKQAQETMCENKGGPFGAVITDGKGNVIAVASNTVLQDNDPTAHAEVNAIRMAGKKLGTYDLSGCNIYATGYPCPMCLSSIIWANIKKVYYGCMPEDADEIGFRDDFIYNFIKEDCSDTNVLELEECGREDCLELFEEYKNTNKTVY